jgi:putative sterol carrier protein
MLNPEELDNKIRNGTFRSNELPDLFAIICRYLNSSDIAKSEVEGWNCKIQYDLGGEADVWFRIQALKFSSGKGKIENPDVILILSEKNAAMMFTGQLDSTSAYMAGDLKIEGNSAIPNAQKFAAIIQIFTKNWETSGSN